MNYLNKLTPTLTVLVIGIPTHVSGWISIRVSASTTKYVLSFVDGSTQGERRATSFALKPVFRACRAYK